MPILVFTRMAKVKSLASRIHESSTRRRIVYRVKIKEIKRRRRRGTVALAAIGLRGEGQKISVEA